MLVQLEDFKYLKVNEGRQAINAQCVALGFNLKSIFTAYFVALADKAIGWQYQSLFLELKRS